MMAGVAAVGRQRQACPPYFLAHRQIEWGLTGQLFFRFQQHACYQMPPCSCRRGCQRRLAIASLLEFLVRTAYGTQQQQRQEGARHNQSWCSCKAPQSPSPRGGTKRVVKEGVMWMTIIAEVGRHLVHLYCQEFFLIYFLEKRLFLHFWMAGEPTEIDVFFQARSAAERGRSR
jgi:hypothetical protein